MPTMPDQTTKRRVYRKEDIALAMNCSLSKASKLIQALNERLKKKGYLTVAGRIPMDFADEQLGLKVRG